MTHPDFAKIKEALENIYQYNNDLDEHGLDEVAAAAIIISNHLSALEARYAAMMAEPTEEVVEAARKAIASQINATGYIDDSDIEAWDQDTHTAAKAALSAYRKAMEGK